MKKSNRCALEGPRGAFPDARATGPASPETDHRIANSLAFLSAMLRFESRAITSAEDARHSLLMAAGRLQAVSKMHRIIAHANAKGTLDLAETISELCRYVSDSFGIEVTSTCDPVEVSAALAGKLAVVINEFATNSVKHANPDGEAIVRVAVSTCGDGRIQVLLSDNGIGLPDDFDMENTTGLGMSIITSTVKRMNGTVENVAAPFGTTFRIVIPVNG